MENETPKTAKEINDYLNSLDIFTYAAVEEKSFENNLAEIGDYERKTTFYSDLSIAERYGADSIKETVDTVCQQWKSDIVFMTEFAMCLNYKSWEWSYRENDELCQLYSDLYYEVRDYIYDVFDGNDDALHYYFEMTD